MSEISELLRSRPEAEVIDHFYLEGRGSVFACIVTQGVIKKGDSLIVTQTGIGAELFQVVAIERDRKLWDEAYPTETVGILVDRDLRQFGEGALICT